MKIEDLVTDEFAAAVSAMLDKDYRVKDMVAAIREIAATRTNAIESLIREEQAALDAKKRAAGLPLGKKRGPRKPTAREIEEDTVPQRE